MIRVRAKTISGERWQLKTKCNRDTPSAVSTALPSIATQSAPFSPQLAGQPLEPCHFLSGLLDANRESGLRWTCLDYRHTVASQLAQNNVSPLQDRHARRQQPGNLPRALRRTGAQDDGGRGGACAIAWKTPALRELTIRQDKHVYGIGSTRAMIRKASE